MEMVLQKLKANKIIRPGMSYLERLVFTARDRAGGLRPISDKSD